MSNKQLGRLTKVELREVWLSESSEFTPWLGQAENLKLLGETIGLELECEAQEKNVGPFRADILCKDTATDSWVLIENQLERTDHNHLGQLLTYAAGLDAVTIVWVAERFTDEHRAALDWLNERTDDKIAFFGLEVELWQIGGSPIAPKFNIVSKPNDWAKTISDTAKQLQAGNVSESKQLQQEFWTEFRKHLETAKSFLKATKALPQHWMNLAVGRGGFKLMATFSTAKERAGAFLVIKGSNAKNFFHQLEAEKDQIEKEIGSGLEWEELPGRKESRLAWRLYNIQPADRSKWAEVHEVLRQRLEKMHKVLSLRVKKLEVSEEAGAETE